MDGTTALQFDFCLHQACLAGVAGPGPFYRLLSLAGFPPLGGFVGKTMFLGAVLEPTGPGGRSSWERAAPSLYDYVRGMEPLHLRSPLEQSLGRETPALRLILVVLALGTLLTGILPQFWISLASRAATLLATGTL